MLDKQIMVKDILLNKNVYNNFTKKIIKDYVMQRYFTKQDNGEYSICKNSFLDMKMAYDEKYSNYAWYMWIYNYLVFYRQPKLNKVKSSFRLPLDKLKNVKSIRQRILQDMSLTDIEVAQAFKRIKELNRQDIQKAKEKDIEAYRARRKRHHLKTLEKMNNEPLLKQRRLDSANKYERKRRLKNKNNGNLSSKDMVELFMLQNANKRADWYSGADITDYLY